MPIAFKNETVSWNGAEGRWELDGEPLHAGDALECLRPSRMIHSPFGDHARLEWQRGRFEVFRQDGELLGYWTDDAATEPLGYADAPAVRRPEKY